MKTLKKGLNNIVAKRPGSKPKAGYVQFGQHHEVAGNGVVAVNLRKTPLTRLKDVFKKVTATRKRKLAVIGCLIVLICLVGMAGWIVVDREGKPFVSNEKPVSGATSAEEFIAIERENANSSNAEEKEKMRRKIRAINYYSNSYQFEKIITELNRLKQEYPNAEEDHLYLTSYFTALLELNRKDDMKTYARKILALEDKGVRGEVEMPVSLRDAINASAQ